MIGLQLRQLVLIIALGGLLTLHVRGEERGAPLERTSQRTSLEISRAAFSAGAVSAASRLLQDWDDDDDDDDDDLPGGAGTTCGLKGHPCCDKKQCSFPHLTCRKRKCTPCGGWKQWACSGRAPCDTGLQKTAGGRCLPGKPCGKKWQSCCSGRTCRSSKLSCDEGICQRCGGKGQPACVGGICNSGLTLQGGRCTPECGGKWGKCCSQGVCNHAGFTCAAGRCKECGKESQPACGTPPACAAGLVEHNGRCRPCGGAWEHCCAAGGCNKASGLVCDSARGKCVRCGTKGERVCGDGSCIAGLVPQGGKCVPCGRKGRVCCPAGGAAGGQEQEVCNGNLACLAGRCERCGRRGQPPCEGDTPCKGKRLVPAGGVCSRCGGRGELCCGDGECSGGYSVRCVSGRCMKCGLEGLPSCNGKCLTEVLLRSDKDVCIRACGYGGEACCDGQCHVGFTCDSARGKCKACGTEGALACPGPRPPCDARLTLNSAGVCEAATCGSAWQQCCLDGDRCGGGLACNHALYTCEPCGGAKQPPCDPPKCPKQERLRDGRCKTPCGRKWKGCCRGKRPCKSRGLTCSGAGKCVPCGGRGRPPCRGWRPCDKGLKLRAGKCVAPGWEDNGSCGSRGAGCCKDGVECDPGLACSQGECTPCGGLHEVACDGVEAAPCDEWLVEVGRVCLACGGAGSQCCAGEPRCKGEHLSCGLDGRCAACGEEDAAACSAPLPPCKHAYLTVVQDKTGDKICARASWRRRGLTADACGDEGHPCCSGATCSSTALTCGPHGACVACGGDQAVACYNSSTSEFFCRDSALRVQHQQGNVVCTSAPRTTGVPSWLPLPSFWPVQTEARAAAYSRPNRQPGESISEPKALGVGSAAAPARLPPPAVREMWINEFGYSGGDAPGSGMFIELAVLDAAAAGGAGLADHPAQWRAGAGRDRDARMFRIDIYDRSSASVVSTINATTARYTQRTTASRSSALVVVDVPAEVAHAAPLAGVALQTLTGGLQEFISQGGPFVAVDGVVAGMLSTDVGAAGLRGWATGGSVQRKGLGGAGDEWEWCEGDTRGAENGFQGTGRSCGQPSVEPESRWRAHMDTRTLTVAR